MQGETVKTPTIKQWFASYLKQSLKYTIWDFKKQNILVAIAKILNLPVDSIKSPNISEATKKSFTVEVAFADTIIEFEFLLNATTGNPEQDKIVDIT